MFLEKFNPASVDPLLLVNREKDQEWLFARLDAYLKSVPPHEGINFVVIGDKGSGKTILTRAVIRKVRSQYSDRVVFIDINCRDSRTARAVFGRIALQLRESLTALRELSRLPNDAKIGSLVANAQILVALTRFDGDAELKVVHEHIEHYREAVKLDGKRSFLKFLSTSFSISLERSERTVETLTGKIRFDVDRLAEAIVALFEDVRDAGFDVLLYLDNLDELRHEYRTEQEIDGVRGDIGALLSMRKAPIALLVNVRTYFSSILGREFPHRRVLRPLSSEDMLQTAYFRLTDKPLSVKQALNAPAQKEAARQLAAIAPAPLVFLTWFHRLVDNDDLEASRLREGLETYLSTHYATLPAATLKAIAGAFGDKQEPISQDLLLSACGSNEAVMHQAQELQVVLPRDFWNPVEFVLDPYLAFLRPSSQNTLKESETRPSVPGASAVGPGGSILSLDTSRGKKWRGPPSSSQSFFRTPMQPRSSGARR